VWPFFEETTPELLEEASDLSTETQDEARTEPDQSVPEQTTEVSLQESTDKTMAEDQTFISTIGGEDREKETTEITSTKNIDEGTTEFKDKLTTNPSYEETNTTDNTLEVTTAENSEVVTTSSGDDVTTERQDRQDITSTESTNNAETTVSEENLTANPLESKSTGSDIIGEEKTYATGYKENTTTEKIEVTSIEGSAAATTKDESITITTENPGLEVTTAIDSGIYEFDCDVTTEEGEGGEDLALECKRRNGETGVEKRTVYIVIDQKNVEGDITRIFDENVRLFVKKVVLEDISPK